MMHRDGWTGNKSTSSTCFAWFVWDSHKSNTSNPELRFFDWKDYVPEVEKEKKTRAAKKKIIEPLPGQIGMNF
jgi:hypothetical protein